MAYEFTRFFARPAVPQAATLPPGATWREISAPFTGSGVRLPVDDRLLTPAEGTELARRLGVDAAERWVYLTYVCWGGEIDFVFGFGSSAGMTFGPIQGDTRNAALAAFSGLLGRFGVSIEAALAFEPFRRGYWGEG